jgi:Trp operon repressor
MKTTLNKIKEHNPCEDGWKKLLTFLNKTEADDEELSLLTILQSNGFNDALWALSAVEGHDKEIRLILRLCRISSSCC